MPENPYTTKHQIPAPEPTNFINHQLTLEKSKVEHLDKFLKSKDAENITMAKHRLLKKLLAQRKATVSLLKQIANQG